MDLLECRDDSMALRMDFQNFFYDLLDPEFKDSIQ